MRQISFWFTLMTGLVFAQVAWAETIQSPTGKQLIQLIEAEVPFEGFSASLDGSAVWPGYLYLNLLAGGKIVGHVEWTSLNHVNYLEGQITETGNFVEIEFVSTKVLVKGRAAANVRYHLVVLPKNDQLQLIGRWDHGDHRGPFEMTSTTAMQGTQSAFLGEHTVDELLDQQVSKQKEELFFKDAAIDWNISGFRDAAGRVRVFLNCRWARDKGNEGPSNGELRVILSREDPENPLLAYRMKRPDWKDLRNKLEFIDVRFSKSETIRIPVKPDNSARWVIAQGPEVKRMLVRLRGHRPPTDDFVQEINLLKAREFGYAPLKSDIHISTADQVKFLDRRMSLPMTPISHRNFDVAWKVAEYLLEGKEPPSIHEMITGSAE